MIEPRALLGLVEEHGSPLYVYDLGELKARIARLRRLFPGFKISYAMKANPNPEIVSLMREQVDHLDVSSGGELQKALELGWEPHRISFTGPGKTPAEISASVASRDSFLIVESVEEALQASRFATERGTVHRVLVRLSPDASPPGFGVRMAGRPTQFGLDETDWPDGLRRIGKLDGLEVKGFHVYSGTQSLKASAVVENFDIMAEAFSRCAGILGINPEVLVFGTGFGVPYHDGMEELDVEAVSAGATELVDRLKRDPRLQDAHRLLELGRWLIGPAGQYLTTVLYTKHSRGQEIAICDGGMHHNLAAAGHLGGVIHRNYRMENLSSRAGSRPNGSPETYRVVGSLCTSIDLLGNAVELDPISPGDVLSIKNSGAYGLTASPINFISHPTAREVTVDSAP
jgi:diaminopimelate decarboxylase